MVKADADLIICIRLYLETVSNGLYLQFLSLCSTILYPALSGISAYTLIPYSIVLYRNCIFMMLLIVHSRFASSLYIAFSLS